MMNFRRLKREAHQSMTHAEMSIVHNSKRFSASLGSLRSMIRSRET